MRQIKLVETQSPLSDHQDLFDSGVSKFIDNLKAKKELYGKIINDPQNWHDEVVSLNDRSYFYDIIRKFGAHLENEKAQYDLKTLYDVAFHKETGALIIANKGATLFSLSPKTALPFITRHIGCCVYHPGIGVEVVNVGIVGDVYNDSVILRTESACSPSFLFGSQRCNCAHQWDSIQELAARLNPLALPQITAGAKFEAWVQEQFQYDSGKHISVKKGHGVVMVHIDSQNGMGSGYTGGEFVFDLYNRASLRHRGEYSAEQIHKTTMKGGFEAIGIEPDPRGENNLIGYKITKIILDWLGIHKNLICLSNNKHKIKILEEGGYAVSRVKSLGMVNVGGAQEAEQRGTEFDHLDINGTFVAFEDEISRLIKEIKEILNAY